MEKLAIASEHVLQELAHVAFVKTKPIKTSDKVRALELLGKYHKLFTERNEVSDAEKVVEQLQAARKRLAEEAAQESSPRNRDE